MSNSKQQFNIYLEPSLITAVKHRAIDEQFSLSDLVAKVLTTYLMNPEKPEEKEPAMQNKTFSLKLQPMIHVDDMAASIKFYEALGATLITGSRDGDWAQLALGGAEIGLLAHPANPEQNEGKVELNFETEEPLETIQEHLAAAGVKIARGAADEAFGAQLQVEAPDGMLVKINRIDPSTFE